MERCWSRATRHRTPPCLCPPRSSGTAPAHEASSRTFSVFEGQKASDQMRPADLALGHCPEAELPAAIADQDALDLGEQSAKARHGAVLGDEEGRRHRRGNGPQGACLAALLPATCVCVFDGLVGDVVPDLFGRGCDRIAHVVLGLAQRAQRDLDAKNVAEKADGAASADVVVAGQQPDQGRQSWFAHPLGHAGRQRCTCDGAAIAGHAMQAPFRHHGHDRRHVHRLVTPRVGVGSHRKVLVATPAGLRETVDGGLGGRKQLTLRSLVPGLSSTLPARRWLAGTSLAIRGAVARRRLARVRRVLTEAGTKVRDLRPQFHVLRAKPGIVGEQRLHHRAEVGDLRFELRDPGVTFVCHTNGRSHLDLPVDPHTCN